LSGALRELDVDLLRSFQLIASYPLDVAGSALSALGGLPVTMTTALTLAVAWTLRDGPRGMTPLAVALVIVLGFMTQRLIPQPGPPMETLRDFHWLALSSGESLSAQAFPSGHVARTCFLGLLLADRHPRIAPIMLGIISAMALSRVYVGSHWPSDVAGGLFLGATVALIVIAFRSARSASPNAGASP
jgi:membrane-associated phospholipid phosphatase